MCNGDKNDRFILDFGMKNLDFQDKSLMANGQINEFGEVFDSTKGNCQSLMVRLAKFVRCLVHQRKVPNH
jgi:hypothetical protein